MCHSENMCVPSLDNARESATLGNSGYVDLFTCRKNVSGDGIAYIKTGAIIKAELLEVSLVGYAGSLKMTKLRLRELSLGYILESELNGSYPASFR